jgi:simple sugar transport system permease protein
MFNKKTLLTLLNSILPVLLALFIGALMILAIGENPFQAYGIMFGRSLFTLRGITNTLHAAAPLLLTGAAIAITFRANLFNMGVEGQLVFGGFMAGLIGVYLHISNPFLHKALCFLVGAGSGTLFALLPAVLRAFLRVDEMVVTLTLNYVMFTLLEFLSSGPFRDQGSGYITTPTIDSNAMFTRFGSTRLTPFFILALLVFLVLWYLKSRTEFGYKIEAIGKNPEFSEATGLRVRKSIIMLILVSGAISGFAGAGYMMSQEYKYTLSFSGNPGLGWDGMLVSLLGGHSPVGIIVASIFYSALKTGADNINMFTSIPKEIVSVIQGIIILFLSIRFLNERFGLIDKLVKRKGAKIGPNL